MPLGLPALSGGLQSVFADPPATADACAQGWADAVRGWCAGIVPPSTTVAAAASALSSSLASAFRGVDAAPAMESAFAAFAGTVGGGMVGYVAVPPPGPVGFASQFSGPKPSTARAAAEALASLIDSWARTGIGTLVAPPNTPVPWT